MFQIYKESHILFTRYYNVQNYIIAKRGHFLLADM